MINRTNAVAPKATQELGPQAQCRNPSHAVTAPEEASEKPRIPRLALVDDDEGIHRFVNRLGKLGHLTLVRSAFTGAEALAHVPGDKPDVVLMDIRLPDMSGIDCAGKLKAILPEVPVIILTGYPDGQSFFRSVMQKAHGFLFKPVLAQELLKAIDDVLKGEFTLAQQAIPFLTGLVQQIAQITRDHHLTPREEEILACLFQGMQDKEIAAALGIGTATVHTHMHGLFLALGVHSRQDSIAKYLALPGDQGAQKR